MKIISRYNYAAVIILVLIGSFYISATQSQSFDNSFGSPDDVQIHIKMNDKIMEKIEQNDKISMTIDEILQTQGVSLENKTESDFLSLLPKKSIAFIEENSNNNEINISYNNDFYYVKTLKEFTIYDPSYKEMIHLENKVYEIIPRKYTFYSGLISDAQSSHVILSYLGTKLISVTGEAVVSNDLIEKQINFGFYIVPEIIANEETASLREQGILKSFGAWDERVITNEVQEETAVRLKTQSIEETISIAGHTTQTKKASIQLFMDPGVTGDFFNFLYLDPDWSNFRSYFDNVINGPDFMPEVKMNQGSKIWNACSSGCDYNSVWLTFLTSFNDWMVQNGYSNGATGSGHDASFIYTNYNLPPASGQSLWWSGHNPIGKTSRNDMWGVFGTNNPDKQFAIAGGETGLHIPYSIRLLTLGHEFGHLMGGAHEPGYGAINGPLLYECDFDPPFGTCNYVQYPGHGAVTYTHWGGFDAHSLMWHTYPMYWSFSSAAFSGGQQGTFTSYPYMNPTPAYNNLYWVRGTVYKYCLNN